MCIRCVFFYLSSKEREKEMHKALIIRSGIPIQIPSPPNRIITTPVIRFAQSQSGPHPTQEEMDSEKQKQPTHPESKTADTMSSFGEAYATRSDEEGFGGIYGGNQYLPNKTGHQEFDHDQGSEVKEKEKARNQEKVAP